MMCKLKPIYNIHIESRTVLYFLERDLSKYFSTAFHN